MQSWLGEFKIYVHEIFITADRIARPVLKRHQAAKFLKDFQVHFVLCSEESDVFVNIFILDVLYILRSA